MWSLDAYDISKGPNDHDRADEESHSSDQGLHAKTKSKLSPNFFSWATSQVRPAQVPVLTMFDQNLPSFVYSDLAHCFHFSRSLPGSCKRFPLAFGMVGRRSCWQSSGLERWRINTPIEFSLLYDQFYDQGLSENIWKLGCKASD